MVLLDFILQFYYQFYFAIYYTAGIVNIGSQCSDITSKRFILKYLLQGHLYDEKQTKPFPSIDLVMEPHISLPLSLFFFSQKPLKTDLMLKLLFHD